TVITIVASVYTSSSHEAIGPIARAAAFIALPLSRSHLLGERPCPWLRRSPARAPRARQRSSASTEGPARRTHQAPRQIPDRGILRRASGTPGRASPWRSRDRLSRRYCGRRVPSAPWSEEG